MGTVPVPSPAEELVLIDRELAQLEARRSWLLARRAWLVSVSTARSPWVAAAPGPKDPGPVREASVWGVRTVLLTLGGVLLVIAALAFTLVSWGSLGIGGRAAVLTAVTVAALAVPVTLVRRGLGATAETVAALALVLTVLDALALYLVAEPWAWGGTGYAAVAAALLCAVWAGYGAALAGLRVPLPSAVVAGQLPVLLGVLAADGDASAVAWALLVTGAADAALAVTVRPVRVRVAAWVAAGVTGGGAVLTGASVSVAAGGVEPAALLAAGAVLWLAVAWRVGGVAARACAVVAGLVAVAAWGGLLREVLPGEWAAVGHLACAVALIAAVGVGPGARVVPVAVRRGLAWASSGVLGLGLLGAVPWLLGALVVRVPELWSGVAPSGSGGPWPAVVAVLLVAGVLLSASVVGARAGGPKGWGCAVAARCGALGLGALTGFVLPVAAGSPYGVMLGAQSLVTAALLAVAVRPGVVVVGLPEAPGTAGTGTGAGRAAAAGTGAGCAVAAASALVALGLATETATLSVLGVLGVLFTGAAVSAGGERGWLRAGSACAAVLAWAGFVGAGAVAAGRPAHGVALALLVVPGATALLGMGVPPARAPSKARGRFRLGPAGAPVELTGAAVGVVSVGLAVARPAVLALVLGLCGVLAAGTALRVERRRVAGPVAAALFLAATWVRLAVWEVAVPEAYALPVAVPALVVGALRVRRDPAVGSWSAYGPGLGAGLLPSLWAAWGDPGWVRPLLLGLVALGVTLAGARLRLRAPLVLGGAVLALVASHELAPYVAQVVGVLPRWLPPALAGVLLLAVGATYERRMRDVRRMREAVGRMR
ncbi:hypothetical protein I3F58_13395 [Streptomyces sp. MUM 203J]|uniref:SCO7613 C-terminal domain-containing membrane protein n=1 Tax=Streptomyces sp. MUM 203J TaxID=2791990 RepID=UPI001F04FFF1|nr:hypothetical protein [Streptomyces sp. MUM 203J]MCH0540546.1 hypothetical protein [Streptomyces sp. MUM 203J]